MIYIRGHHLKILLDYSIAKENNTLELKKTELLSKIIQDGHDINFGLNVFNVFEQTLDSNESIALTDTIDDICKLCHKKDERACIELMSRGISATYDDKLELHFYNLKKKVYASEYLLKRLKKRGFS